MALLGMEHDTGTQTETLSTNNYAIYNDKVVTVAINKTDRTIPAQTYTPIGTVSQALRPKNDVYRSISINGGAIAVSRVGASTGDVQIYSAAALADQWIHDSVTYAL